MSFRSLAHDIGDIIGSLSRRSSEVRPHGHHRGKSHGALHKLPDQPVVVRSSCWAYLPPELLRDVIKRLEESESTWPARKHVVACAAVCRSWREICKEIVQCPEFCGILTFPVSLKQPGFRDGTIQCFIKRDKSNFHLLLCLSPALLVENGKFLLSAKLYRRFTARAEYVISMDADNISTSSSSYIGKVRSNYLGSKFKIYDTQPPYNCSSTSPPGRTSRRFYSKKVSRKAPSRSYNIAQVIYDAHMPGASGPRRMHCIMHSIPSSSLDPGGTVPSHPKLLPRPLEDSFRSISFSKSIDNSTEFSSARFSDTVGQREEEDGGKDGPLVLKNKPPRWHEQLQCWGLNFGERVTVASVKNFQLIAATTQPAAGAPTPSEPAQSSSDHDKIILQFGQVGEDIFTMDYRYPLSAFQAFAICLSSFDKQFCD